MAKIPVRNRIGIGVIDSYASDSAYLAATGSTPQTGDIYFNNASDKYRYFNGTAFTDLTFGTQPIKLIDHTLSSVPSGPTTVDSEPANVGDLVLLANYDNTVYTVESGTWTQASFFNSLPAPTAGNTVFVTNGSVYGNTIQWFDGTTWRILNLTTEATAIGALTAWDGVRYQPNNLVVTSGGTITTPEDSNNDSNPANSLTIQSGNKTAGTGDGGSLILIGGTSSGGNRGQVTVEGSQLNINSNTVPSLDNTYDMGSSSKAWKTMWVSSGGINISLNTNVNSGQIKTIDQPVSGSSDPYSILSGNTAGNSANSGLLSVITGDTAGTTSNTGNIALTTGNASGASSNSGNISLTTGTSSSGTRGKISLNGSLLNIGASSASDPVSGMSAQDVYYNTTEGRFKFYDGTAWRVADNSDFTQEPTGFQNQTDSSVSFDGPSRTLSISVKSPATSWTVFRKGVKHIFSSTQSVTIPNTTGLYLIYFNSNFTLQYQLGFSTSLILSDVFVATVYWNATTSQFILGDERHGLEMDGTTHLYLHQNFGMRYSSGLAISGYTLAGTGNAAADAEIALSGGSVADEDLIFNITDSASPSAPFQQTLSPIAQIPILYRSGANGDWVTIAANNYPVHFGTTRATYNQYTGGSWQLTDVPTDKHHLAMFIFATNNPNAPIVAIMGQDEYQKLDDATANANYDSLQFGTLPAAEFKYLYRLIFETDSAYTNAVKSALRHVQDYRKAVDTGVTQNSSPTDHSALTGRSATNSHPASAISVNAGAFGGFILSGTDTDVQTALNDIDTNALKNTFTNSASAGSDPGVAVQKQVYYSTVEKRYKYYDGTAWRPFGGVGGAYPVNYIDKTSTSLPSSSPYNPDGTAVISDDLVLFTALSPAGDRGVYKATVSGGSVTWARQIFGQSSTGASIDGDFVWVKSGTSYADRLYVCINSTSCVWEDYVATIIANSSGNLTSTDLSVTGGTGAILGSGVTLALNTVPISKGGTGQTTQQAAINALTGTQSVGKYLRSDGTDATLSSLQASDLSGTVAIANGGTGQTTASAAFNALSPITSTGDLIIGNGLNSATSLSIGTSGYVLTSDGTTANWASIPSSANTSLSNLTSPTAVNMALIPGSSGLDLGSTANEWNNIYTDYLHVQDSSNVGALLLGYGPDLDGGGWGMSLSDQDAESQILTGNPLTESSVNAIGIATVTRINGPSASIYINTGSPNSSGSNLNSGNVNVNTGFAVNGNSGSILQNTGGASGNSGQIGLATGSTAAGNSGQITLTTGDSGLASSGNITLTTGSAFTTRGTVHVNPELRLDGSTSGYVGIKSPSSPTSYTVTLPSSQGGAGTVLTNNGSGALSWSSPSAASTQYTLSDNIAVPTTAVTTSLTSGMVMAADYSIKRSSSYEVGQLFIAFDGTNVSLSTNGTTLGGSTGIVLSAINASGNVAIQYTSTSTGSTANLTLAPRQWTA